MCLKQKMGIQTLYNTNYLCNAEHQSESWSLIPSYFSWSTKILLQAYTFCKKISTCLFSMWSPQQATEHFCFFPPFITMMETLFVTFTGVALIFRRLQALAQFQSFTFYNEKTFKQKSGGADQAFYLLWWLRTEMGMKTCSTLCINCQFSCKMCSLVQLHFDRSTPMDLLYQCTNHVRQLLFVWKNESTATNTYNTSLHF